MRTVVPCSFQQLTKIMMMTTRAHSYLPQNLVNSAATQMRFHGSPRLHMWNSVAWLNHELTSQIYVMNLWILHYSLINHHYHQSTITIKPKNDINKLVTELIWGHFLWKKVVWLKNIKFHGISRQKGEFCRLDSTVKTQIPRLVSKFRGPRKTVGPNNDF